MTDQGARSGASGDPSSGQSAGCDGPHLSRETDRGTRRERASHLRHFAGSSCHDQRETIQPDPTFRPHSVRPFWARCVRGSRFVLPPETQESAKGEIGVQLSVNVCCPFRAHSLGEKSSRANPAWYAALASFASRSPDQEIPPASRATTRALTETPWRFASATSSACSPTGSRTRMRAGVIGLDVHAERGRSSQRCMRWFRLSGRRLGRLRSPRLANLGRTPLVLRCAYTYSPARGRDGAFRVALSSNSFS